MQIPSMKRIWEKINEKMKRDSYPLLTVIRHKRRGGSVVALDRLKRVDRTTFKRLSNGDVFEAPELSEVDIMVGGGSFVELWSPEYKVYTPIKFIENKDSVSLISANTNYVNWAKMKMVEIRQRHQNKKSTVEQYMPVLLVIGTGLAIAMILYYASENWRQLAPLTSALSSVAETLKSFIPTQGSGPLKPIGG